MSILENNKKSESNLAKLSYKISFLGFVPFWIILIIQEIIKSFILIDSSLFDTILRTTLFLEIVLLILSFILGVIGILKDRDKAKSMFAIILCLFFGVIFVLVSLLISLIGYM